MAVPSLSSRVMTVVTTLTLHTTSLSIQWTHSIVRVDLAIAQPRGTKSQEPFQMSKAWPFREKDRERGNVSLGATAEFKYGRLTNNHFKSRLRPFCISPRCRLWTTRRGPRNVIKPSHGVRLDPLTIPSCKWEGGKSLNGGVIKGFSFLSTDSIIVIKFYELQCHIQVI